MRRWLLLPLLLLGLMACQDNGPTKMDWSYSVGSNADEIWHTRALFSREGVRCIFRPIMNTDSGLT